MRRRQMLVAGAGVAVLLGTGCAQAVPATTTAMAATQTGSASADGTPARAAVQGMRAAAGARLWVARFRAKDLSDAMALSPDGSRLYVTGGVRGRRGTGSDSETIAYSAAHGRPLWVSRYHGPGNGSAPAAVAVSPGGRRVFVTGIGSGRRTGPDYVTAAYNAATGRQLWVNRYSGPGIGTGNDFDGAAAMAVSPGGAAVFVTGTSTGRGTGQSDYATVAYSAATGRQLWVRRYNGPANGLDGATAAAVSPAGDKVFVTGTSDGLTPGQYATIAYGAATGRQLWISRYHGPGKSDDGAAAMVVSPDGSLVFVTGTSNDRTGNGDYATVAYSAATGGPLWVGRYHGPANGYDNGASAMALSPGGTTVFVTGSSGRRSTYNYATVAYRAATGRQLWVSRYRGYEAESVAVSPDRTTVYVTGYNGLHGDYATVAYRAATGRQLWASRYHGPKNNGGACCLAVSPAGHKVFVTGWSQGLASYDYATVAYRS